MPNSHQKSTQVRVWKTTADKLRHVSTQLDLPVTATLDRVVDEWLAGNSGGRSTKIYPLAPEAPDSLTGGSGE